MYELLDTLVSVVLPRLYSLKYYTFNAHNGASFSVSIDRLLALPELMDHYSRLVHLLNRTKRLLTIVPSAESFSQMLSLISAYQLPV